MSQPGQHPGGDDPQWGSALGRTGGSGPASGPADAFALMRPGIVPLRPLGLGDVLGGALQMYRFNPRAMILAPLLLIGGLSLALAPAVYLLDPRGTSFAASGLGGAPGQEILLYTAAALLPTLAAAVVGPVVSAATHAAVIGHRFSPTARLGLMARRGLVGVVATLLVDIVILAWAGLWTALVLGVNALGAPLWAVVLLGVLAALVALAGSVVLTVRVLFTPYAVYREGVGPITALRRSFALTRGAFWRTLGFYLLAQVVASAISQVLSLVVVIPVSIAGALAERMGVVMAGTLVATGIATALVVPFTSAAITLMYLDRRIRVEGLDMRLAHQAREVADDPESEAWLTTPAAPPDPAAPR